MPNDEISPGTKTGVDQLAKAATDDTGFARALASQQVSWWSVHEHVLPLLNSVDSWPMVGTPEWCELPDGDVRKVAAVFDAAQHWALRVETSQEARCQASQDIAAAFDWKRIAQSSFVRDCSVEYGAYIPRLTS